MSLAHSSIRRKLTRIVLVTCGAALVVSCTIFGAYDVYVSRRTTLQTLTTLAQITGANSSAAVSFSDVKSAAEILNSLRSEKQIMHAVLYTLDGKVLAIYNRDEAENPFIPPPAGKDEARFSGNRIVVFRSIQVNGHSARALYVESDTSAIIAREQGLAGMLGIALLASLLMALIVGPILQKPITEPILELARTAFAVSVEKNYSIRAASQSTDEIGYLYTQFNQMLDRLEQRDAELKQIRTDLENRVAERTAFLSALIDAIPLGLIASDQRGTVLSVNPSFTKIFGYSREESVGKVLDELIVPPELLTEGREYTRKRIEGQSFRIETKRKRKDGSLVDVEVHGVPLFIQGKIAGGFALYQNVTARRRSEEAIREANSMLNSLIEGSPLAIVVTDIDGTARSINPAFSQLFGYSAEEITGANLDDLVAPAEHLDEARAPTRGSQEGGIVHLETRRKRKDGSPVDVELHSVPLQTHGKTVASFAIYQDISHRKQAEEKLCDANANLNAIIQASPLGIVTTDQAGRILICNRAFEELFQFSMTEAAGADLNTLIVPPELRLVGEELTRRGKAGEAVHATTRRRRKDGTSLDVELYGVSLLVGGKRAGELVLYQDITDRIRAEEELKNAKVAAEQASRAKSDFLANMSHEIRTPMNGIIGMTELTLETELNSEQRDYLGMVKTSAEALLHVINDILDFSKVEAGKLELEHEPFAFRAIVGETMKVLGHSAHRKKLELAWQAAADVPEWVVGDRGRLRQMLVNLVGNAIKFTEQGEVVVTVSLENWVPQGVELHFRLSDTGIGIPAEKQRLIFDAFTQADGSTTRKYGGTGLGLAIVQRLAGLQGGHLWVESELGRGSVFHFTVRLGLPEKSFVVPKESETGALRGLRILVVDDNRTNRLILAELLRRWGMLPEEAASGKEALEFLERASNENKATRIVLLDAQMPERDGFTLARLVRENPRFSSPAIVMLSAAARAGDSERSLKAGIAAYLTKPVQPSELLDAILNAFTRTGGAPSDPVSITSQSSAPVTLPGLRILLAEDNAVNRQLAIRLLEKRGHFVFATKNGREALEVLEKSAFDLALFDVQMPEIDGLEATRTIRSKEKGTGSHLPIIAVTAHVMKGDRENCIEAGADDYISKPIQPGDLYAAIERFRGAPKVSEFPGPKVLAASSTVVLDPEEMLRHVQCDRELLANMARLFGAEAPSLLQELHDAVARGDTVAISRVSHSLKGALSNFGSGPAYQAALNVETLADSGDAKAAGAAIPVLDSEIERLQTALEPYCSPVVK